jgi:Tol biopolymer transport system component
MGRAAAVVLALAIVAIGAGLGLTLRGHASGPNGAGPSLEGLLSRTPNAVVFSEFGVEADTIWAADLANPSDRVELGAAPHAPGYGVFPALSPDGAYVAYAALGAGAADSRDRSTGQLALLDVTDGSTRVLANGIDLRSAPVWSAGSDAVVVRRAGPSIGPGQGMGNELLRVGLDGTAQTIAAANAGLYAIDFAPDGGGLYYASLSASGTDLMRAATSPGMAGAPQTVAHLSDGIARNWKLSPDGSQLAYLAQTPPGSATAFETKVLDIEDGTSAAPLGADAGAQFNPIWGDGTITIGHVAGAEHAALRIPANGVSAAGSPLPAPAFGFDVPISWSPDGAWLIVRAFEGASAADPGPSHLVAIDASGARHQLSPQSDVEIAGWLSSR